MHLVGFHVEPFLETSFKKQKQKENQREKPNEKSYPKWNLKLKSCIYV